jgi:hypothetical protein
MGRHSYCAIGTSVDKNKNVLDQQKITFVIYQLEMKFVNRELDNFTCRSELLSARIRTSQNS